MPLDLLWDDDAFLYEAAVILINLLCAPLTTERNNIATTLNPGETWRFDSHCIDGKRRFKSNSIHELQQRTVLATDNLPKRRHLNDNLALCRISDIFRMTNDFDLSQPFLISA